VKLSWADLGGRKWTLQDQLTAETIVRDGDDLTERGLYLNVPAWRVHIFLIKDCPEQAV
jgi:hypothetical protein